MDVVFIEVGDIIDELRAEHAQRPYQAVTVKRTGPPDNVWPMCFFLMSLPVPLLWKRLDADRTTACDGRFFVRTRVCVVEHLLLVA